MDNKQKIDFIAKLERRDKIKKILLLLVAAIALGSVVIYAQYKHNQSAPEKPLSTRQ